MFGHLAVRAWSEHPEDVKWSKTNCCPKSKSLQGRFPSDLVTCPDCILMFENPLIKSHFAKSRAKLFWFCCEIVWTFPNEIWNQDFWRSFWVNLTWNILEIFLLIFDVKSFLKLFDVFFLIFDVNFFENYLTYFWRFFDVKSFGNTYLPEFFDIFWRGKSVNWVIFRPLWHFIAKLTRQWIRQIKFCLTWKLKL